MATTPALQSDDQRTPGKYEWALLAAFTVVLAWSAVRPHDYFTWFLEVVPALIALAVLAFTYTRLPLTRLAYTLIVLHAIVLMIGGHYTYARVPLFDWIREVFHQARNNYDRLGHFMQGAVPAVIVREVLLRRTPLKRGGWLFYIVTSCCLAISAGYEFFEWGMAVWTGSAADDFLGSQGDPWDTQTDMLMALIGAMVAQLLLSHRHDRELRERKFVAE